MKLRSVVWVALAAIVVGGASLGSLANPMTALPGYDDVPYFSDIFGAPKTHFAIGEKVYVAYFESASTCFNDHVNAPDEMGVAVDSQSTEGCPVALNSGTVTDGADVNGPPPCGAVGGNSGPNEGTPDTLAGGSPNAAYLGLHEITPGLAYDWTVGAGDGPNAANNSGFFIGDVSTTPVTVLAGDKLVVGLSANNQGTAYVQIQLTGGAYMWYDSVSNVDPGTRGWVAGGAPAAVGNPGDGAYGLGDEMVWEATIHGYCAGVPPFWYYRVNGGAWIPITPTQVGGAYPTWRLGFTPPTAGLGSVFHGALVEYLYDPTGTATVGATPVFGDTIIDQPVDLANNTYSGPPVPTVAPDDGCAGFQNEYMTIHQANADVGGNGWWIGVHAPGGAQGPDAPDYDYGFDTFPININAFTGLTIIGGSQPVVLISGTGLGFDIQAGGSFTTIDNLNIVSDATTATRLIQLTNGPTDVTIRNCSFSTVGNATMGINVGAAGSTRLTIDNNTWTAMDAGDGAIWTEGPNPNLTVTDNTFNGGGTASGYCIQGLGWTNGLIDNNQIDNTAAGGILLLADNGGAPSAQASANVTITRNTITNSANGIRFYSSGSYGPVVTGVTIEGNALTGNTNAIRVNDGGAALDTANFTVKYNHIVGNTTGISDTDAGAVLNAELNWWGSTAGPTHAAGNADGAGDASTDNVDYRPWLNGAPFAGVGVTLNDNVDPAVQGNKTVQSSSWYWTINQALTATNALGCGGGSYCQTATIDVAPGTYAEEIHFGYGDIGSTILRSTGGKAVTNIEAGQDANIIFVGNAPQNLLIGDGGTANRGFTIYFDAAAVPGPTVDKIVFQGSSLDIFDCDILGTTGTGIHVNSASAGGSIVNSTIDDCDTSGIWLQVVGGAGFTIDNCTITNGGDGISVDSGANTITNCLIQFNTFHGIDLSSNGNTVGGSGNIIRNNAQNGLRIVGNNNTVSGNTIHNNGDRGIDITGNSNTFNNNQITSNAAQGVILRGASAGNVFNTDNSAANTNCIYDNDSDGSCSHEQMRNLNTATVVDATNNYWGSDKGPFNAMENPSGDMNNRITDFIDATPFALTCGGGTADATIALNCGAGWYLTSVPLVPGDPIAEHVYSALPVFAAYQYNPTTGGYDDLTGQNINWSDGYWLWLMGNETVTVVGGEVTTDQVFALGDAGWQQFSVPSVDIPVTGPDEGGRDDPDILFRAPGGPWYTYTQAILNGLIVDGIFYYDTCRGAYDPAMGFNAVLDPWNGYWIETLVNGVEVSVPVAYWIANPWVSPMGFRPMSVDTNGRTPPPPPVLPASLRHALDEETGVIVTNEPNPIRDVNTTRFHAMAADPIDAILVQIFDQTGALVFAEEQPGDELIWHTDNSYGEFLANGVYLYRVSVLINGQWVVTEVRKLAIFR